MNRNIKALIVGVAALAAVSGSSASLHAQEWFGAATWQISFPSSDTKDFVNSTSFRGVGLDFRKVVAPATTAGFMVGWNVFHERYQGTSTMGNLTVTGTQDRYINSFPIMVNVHRYFGERHGPRPYVGVNAGAFVVIRTFGLGVYASEEDSWDWGIAPEVGIFIPSRSGAGIIINGRYNWSFTHQNLAGRDEDLTYWGLNIGFVWEQY